MKRVAASPYRLPGARRSSARGPGRRGPPAVPTCSQVVSLRILLAVQYIPLEHTGATIAAGGRRKKLPEGLHGSAQPVDGGLGLDRFLLPEDPRDRDADDVEREHRNGH